jgi:hypothetical protein
LRERAPDLTSHAGLVAAGALAIGLADAALIVNGQLGAFDANAF